MEKKTLRQQVLADLKGQEAAYKKDYDWQLAQRFFASPVYQEAQVLAIYLAFDFEYDTSLILERALADGKDVVVPKTFGQGQMIFVAYDADHLHKTSYGLWEPDSDVEVPKSEIDVILVPGLAFNQKGHRIGYGGGYYDRYLADYGGETLSLIYPCQLSFFQEDQHDIPVKGLFYDADETIF